VIVSLFFSSSVLKVQDHPGLCAPTARIEGKGPVAVAWKREDKI
jgi:hypothetical protein